MVLFGAEMTRMEPDFRKQSDPGRNAFDETIRHTFFPGKFAAPRIEAALHLFRARTLRPLMNPPHRRPRTIVIEARAGQGKSTLAAQFLQHVGAPFTWCNCGPEDRELRVLITALFAALLKAFPGLKASRLYTMIARAQLIEDAADTLAQQLMQDLPLLAGDAFYLVLDDLHTLDGARDSLAFIQAAIAHAPPPLRFILISRSPVPTSGTTVVHLDNDALAMSHSDTAELFAAQFKVSLPAEAVAELQRITEGWAMGLVMAGHVVSGQVQRDPAVPVNTLLARGTHLFWRYFEEDVFNGLSLAERRALLTLALVENIPLGLAHALVPLPDPATFLETLVQRNFFLRRLDETPPCYRFHHLFQEFLRIRAQQALTARVRRSVLARAAHWYLRHAHHERALRYYLEAKALGMVEKILRETGAQLLATNRMTALQEHMPILAPEEVRPYAWLSFFIASVYVRNAPHHCLVYLEQAHRQFTTDGDQLGELMAATTLVAFHAGIDCRFKEGAHLLPRAEALYRTLAERLSVPARIQSGYALAYGLCFFEGRTGEAAVYARECLKLARGHGLDDAGISTSVALGLIRSLEGDWSAFRREIEQIQPLLRSPRAGDIAKMGLGIQELTLLALEGDPAVYEHYRELLLQDADTALLAPTIFGPMLLLADLHHALAVGHLEEALRIANQGLNAAGSSASAHMQSQFHSYLAYLHALGGRPGEAETAAQKAERLRSEAGGPNFDVLNRTILGATFALLGSFGRAETLLTRAIEEARRLGAKYLLVSAYAHRACLYLAEQKRQAFREDIRHCLEVMHRQSYRRFYTFTPQVALKILPAAVEYGIEVNLARQAARPMNAHILDQGTAIPLLEITTLGRLALAIAAETRMRPADLTVSQRELLALLIGAPQTGLSHEVIQEAFWPESQPAKMRSKLDNLLARLRKAFNQALAPHSASHYLVMTRGHVRLQNCRIDALEFLKSAAEGFSHVKMRAPRQAEMAFYKALLLYEGHFMPGVLLRTPADHFQTELQHRFRECAQIHIRLLAEGERLAEAVTLCRKALKFDPTHQPLVKALYHLQIRCNEPVQARRAVADYEKALVRDGFTPTEIGQIFDDFWCEA